MKQSINFEKEMKASIDVMQQQQPNEAQYQAMQNNLDRVVAEQALRNARANLGENQGGYKDIANKLLQILRLFYRPKMLAGSAAMIAVFMTGILFLTTSSSTAFAKVIEHLNNIQTMTYSSELISRGKKIMQLNVLYQAPGYVRVETTPANGTPNQASMINIIDTLGGRGLILMPSGRIAVPFKFDSKPENTSIADDPLQWFDVVREFKGDVEILEPILINEKYAQGYVIKESGMLITIWADLETHIPVKFSLQNSDAASINVFEMEAEIMFNKELEQSLFSLKIPSGYVAATSD